MIDIRRSGRRAIRFVALVGGVADGLHHEAPMGWPLAVKRPIHDTHRSVARHTPATIGRDVQLSEIRAFQRLIECYRSSDLKPKQLAGSVLFLGGPWDGRRELVDRFPVSVPTTPLKPKAWVSEATPFPFPVGLVSYRRESFKAGGTVIRLALVNSLSIPEAIDLLISNYQPIA